MPIIAETPLSTGTGAENIPLQMPKGYVLRSICAANETNQCRIGFQVYDRASKYTVTHKLPNVRKVLHSAGVYKTWEGYYDVDEDNLYLQISFRDGDKAAGDALYIYVNYERK